MARPHVRADTRPASPCTSTGVPVNRKNGSTGTVDNAIPMTVGGKIDCDQIDITCDYFSGQIDYLRITKG